MNFLDFFKAGLSDFVFLNVSGHFLFIIALCGVFTTRSWQKVTGYVLVYAICYLFTFFLSWADLFSLPEPIMKYLIPITIIAISITNFFVKKKTFTNRYPSQNYRYYFAILAGLIHGFDLALGKQAYTLTGALAYHLGFTVCIVLTMTGLLIIARFLTYFLQVKLREWNLIISGACAGIAAFRLYLGI